MSWAAGLGGTGRVKRPTRQGRGIWRIRIRSVCTEDWNLAGRGECSKLPEEGSTSRPSSDMQPGGACIPGFGRRPYTADLVSQRPQLGCLLEIVETLALTLIIFVVIQNFIAQPYKVQQSSMERTLMQEQYVLVDKLTPRFDAYKRGDIVVFTPPEDWVGADRTPFIKRVIGVGGDTVEIHDGGVYINGERLDEPYIYAESNGSVQTTDAAQERWVIPGDELFLMGDHRQDSADSRAFGPVPANQVIGRAWLRYWPFDTFGVLATPTYAAPSESPAP
jgi:signal peptidase I